MSLLKVNNISMSYDSEIILNGAGFELKEGEIACLLGKSGCGKTTILRCIAGFEKVFDGEIYIDNKLASSQNTHLSPGKRGIGMVFQDYALFPHLTVYQNVAFALKGADKTTITKDVNSVLELVKVADKKSVFPHELSGGQQQRVALARALVNKPKLILMDEPFSNLDTSLRETLSREVREILKINGTTALMVTHSINEAFAMSDKVGVVSSGKIIQWDSPYMLYHRPANTLVSEFTGEGVILRGQVVEDGRISCGLGYIKAPFSCKCENNCSVNVLIRPEDIEYDANSSTKAIVSEKVFRGSSTMYKLLLQNGENVLVSLPSHYDFKHNEQIGIRPSLKEIILMA
ncbi:MAG: ABC transporter ATP-binding protein [Denitrovibrio sp.]|nr:MAG: ABC transporter ATP-binding protein [Denitrovibrio sp.]